jgi:PTS system nitrogen regulatory IIA component
VVLCPNGIDFEAIDGEKVKIVFGVVGPKRATGEHLRTLARISRLLRDVATREKLVASPSSASALELIQTNDARAEGKA